MKHSILVCLVACLLPLMVACGGQEESFPDTTANEAMLFLNIKPIEQTRAADLSDNEKMHTVRVIVLHPDGTVEHNRHYELYGALERKNILLAVKANETKKIFLFANEESVASVEGVAPTGSLTSFFESYPEGSNKNDFEATVNSLYFTPNYSEGRPIPMSSMYEITEPLEPGTKIEREFHVVRVATKFDVTITNNRLKPVTLKSFAVNSIADKSYLYPHFKENAGIITDSGRHGFIFNDDCTFKEGDKVLPWVDWLAKTCEESQTKPEAPQADKRGWIMEYTVPAGTKYNSKTWDVAEKKIPAYGGKLTLSPTQYCPESCNMVNGITPFHSAAQGIEQQYRVTIALNSDGKDVTFNEPLPNLRALFRNTHVVVNITLNKEDIVVDVIPYGEVKLPPVFGLDEKPKDK